MTCPICGTDCEDAFSATILRRYIAEYYSCPTCGYLGIKNPHWLDEAYSSAIATMDTGVLERNLVLARRCTPAIYSLLRDNRSSARCLDFAGGYGVFTRLMRDTGFDYFWVDKYSENLFARGFEHQADSGDYHVVSAFEVLEHAIDPVGLVREALELANPQVLLFTTVLFEGDPPATGDWWYYAFETGQHVSFFQRRTLETMAAQVDMEFTTYQGLHAFSRRPLERTLRLGGSRLTRVLAPVVRRRMESRTFSDHELVRNRLNDTGT